MRSTELAHTINKVLSSYIGVTANKGTLVRVREELSQTLDAAIPTQKVNLGVITNPNHADEVVVIPQDLYTAVVLWAARSGLPLPHVIDDDAMTYTFPNGTVIGKTPVGFGVIL